MGERKIDDNELLEMLKDPNKKRIDIAAHFGVSPAAITKRAKRLTVADVPEMPESFSRLTEKEQRFCLEKAQGSTHTQAAFKSYECGSLQSAKSIGTQLMNKPEINEAIQGLMEQEGIDKRYRVRKLKQHIDSQSADISLKALDQSWKLDGSYAPEKHIHAHAHTAIPLSAEVKARVTEALQRQGLIPPMSEQSQGQAVNGEVIDVIPESTGEMIGPEFKQA